MGVSKGPLRREGLKLPKRLSEAQAALGVAVTG